MSSCIFLVEASFVSLVSSSCPLLFAVLGVITICDHFLDNRCCFCQSFRKVVLPIKQNLGYIFSAVHSNPKQTRELFNM